MYHNHTLFSYTGLDDKLMTYSSSDDLCSLITIDNFIQRLVLYIRVMVPLDLHEHGVQRMLEVSHLLLLLQTEECTGLTVKCTYDTDSEVYNTDI